MEYYFKLCSVNAQNINALMCPLRKNVAARESRPRKTTLPWVQLDFDQTFLFQAILQLLLMILVLWLWNISTTHKY